MALTDSEGRNIPFFIDDYTYFSIATADFSPSEDPSPADMPESEVNNYMDKGFLVMPHADGTIYGITWRAWVKNGKQFTISAGGKADLTPKIYKGVDGEWIPCRMVKIYSSADATYPSIPTTINIEIPL